MWSNISSSSSSNKTELKQAILNNSQLGKQISSPNEINKSSSVDCPKGSPLMRYKHAVCSAPTGYIYIHGGRFGNLALDDDVWRFDPHQNVWLQLETIGCKPPSLQEHTLVEYNEHLYLFGGQVSASNNENSFWQLNLKNNEWRSLDMKSTKFGAHLGPTNRRGHSAIVHAHSMYIYGGFEDFRGSSGQLWEFDLVQQRWELSNLSSTSSCHPEPRHSHSAVIHDNSMYVYGGLSNLKPLSDLWRWSWREKRWFKERTRGKSPGQLHGHTAIQAFGSMFVFGGERNGRTTRSLWRLNLSNMTWQKIRPKGPRPSPTTWHVAIANPLNILDEANYIIEGDPELLNTSPFSDSCFSSYDHQANSAAVKLRGSSEIETPQAAKILSHSKSSNADLLATRVNLHLDRSKRRSRLSFLRKPRQNRARSSYELKQLQHSASTSTFNPTNRQSISTVNKPAQDVVMEDETKDQSEGNATILDNLDTDIKQMFQRALSPGKFGHKEKPIFNESTCFEADPSITSGISNYQTARQTDPLVTKSQRTSYAYTTPPSELNTLRDLSTPFHASKQPDPWVSGALLAEGSGYDRKDNRPKSEIVQSLIERADARIKHLYTPFFQHPNEQAIERQSRLTSRNRHSLDRSKRHTIHQTMTYYNLYFSEDVSSPVEASSNSESGLQKDSQNTRLVRDDSSSCTIKNIDLRPPDTDGALVGVHGCLQTDQESQISLATTSSDSKTLCGELNHNISNSEPSQTMSVPSSLPNALTAKRDTPGESCDNTSLSFSVIAEFEEDDMLQYSSPTEPIIVHNYLHNDDYKSNYQPGVEHESYKKMSPDLVQQNNNVQNEIQQDCNKFAHKSASSGYDSISGYEQSNRIQENRPEGNQSSAVCIQASTSDTQEDSSVRTESSLGFTTTETSPEQSAMKNQYKKMKGRPLKNRKGLKTTTSSTTADSLAFASDGFESSMGCLPNKSLPSSPPRVESLQTKPMTLANTIQKPLVSGTKFFGKHKSKNRYWQLCMFVMGGKHSGAHGVNEPITIWRLYI